MVLRADGRVAVPAHEAGIKRLVLETDGDSLVSLSYDRSMRLWCFHHNRDVYAATWPSCSPSAVPATLVTFLVFTLTMRRANSTPTPRNRLYRSFTEEEIADVVTGVGFDVLGTRVVQASATGIRYLVGTFTSPE